MLFLISFILDASNVLISVHKYFASGLARFSHTSALPSPRKYVQYVCTYLQIIIRSW